MKKLLASFAFCLTALSSLAATDDVVGFWKTVNEKTGKSESIVAVYEHNTKFYGRIIATYGDNGKIDDTIEHPVDRAPGVVGNPYYAGLDIMWNLQPNGKKYSNGHIMDPEKGRIYDAEMWREGRHLIVRGEILFFGRNQAWDPALDSDFPEGFNKPDLAAITPNILQIKK